MSTAIAWRFLAGRYHAAPWDKHANEAEIEWPPSPWRILRALVATWHRKLSPADYPEEELAGLIERLASADPVYSLPPIIQAHSRHYMPVQDGRPVLIFDAFARLDADAELIVAWPGLVLNERERQLLGAIVNVIGFLGRAESWVEAWLLPEFTGEFNCAVTGLHADERDEVVPVRVLAPIPQQAYTEWRDRTIAELGLSGRRLTRAQRATLAMMPARLIDALRVETGDLRTGGWNLPPGTAMVTYDRLRARRVRPRPRSALPTQSVTTARIALAGKPLPRIEDAVRIGELVRKAAIRVADRMGGPGRVPPEISGHDCESALNHQHAFYLPEDADGDGFIDHVLIHAPGGLSHDAVMALDGLHERGIWTPDGEEWAIVFEGAWAQPMASRSCYGCVSRRWRSVTPYLHPWYAKRGFGIQEQIARECAQRGWPAPATFTILPSVQINGRERRAIHFHRFRSKRGLRQPDRRGSLLELTFDREVEGPIVLGFGCHFGLGMFAPTS